MTDDRADGPTFALEDICWLDFEAKSNTNIKAGTYRYACEADAIVLAYAIGDGPVRTVSLGLEALCWADMPLDLEAFYNRAAAGEAVFAAWNAGFDRAIWNYATLGFPEMLSHAIIDVMAQAVASGLPPDLNYAAKFSGSTHKVAAGKSLISLFCVPDAAGTPQDNPVEWAEFLDYAKGDIVAMRDIFQRTRQLPRAEWQEYWAMEAINARGIGIDLDMVKAAAALAEQDRERSRQELVELSNGAIRGVDQVKRMVEWLLERLPPAGRDILLKREAELDQETGIETIPAEFNLTRKQVERLLAFCSGKTELSEPARVLQIRLYGGSKTPAKFNKMLSQHVDGTLFGQYVFNGAAQTGRASSKGVQIHNLMRDSLPYEHAAIEALLRGDNYRQFATIGDNSPVSRKLSLLIRPAFIPRETNVFVWSDWSQIEARVLPWLCDHLPGARDRLDIFRGVDDDPSLPDLYTLSAAALGQCDPSEVTREARQRGKVVELALGFCGGKNALQAMAAAYGLHLDDAEAQHLVNVWRGANSWAVDYSRELWDAMLRARELPGALVPAGRVGFCWLPGYLGGSLVCRLPSGRLLTYRAMRWEMLDKTDDRGVVIGQSRELTYARGHGRAKLWPGIFVENVTQAVAADILRGTLLRLENRASWMPVRLHTHDEVLIETEIGNELDAEQSLREIMQQGFAWSEGLPLMSQETIAPYYSKRA